MFAEYNGQISKRQTGENATRGKMRWAGGSHHARSYKI